MTADDSRSRFHFHLLRQRRGIVLLLGVATALALWLFWPSDTPTQATPPPSWGGPVPVRIVEATREAIDIELTALGTVTPLNTVTVRSRVEGELMKVLFDEGQRVQAGDLLAEIDARSYEVALAEAEGQQQQNLALLKNAESNLKLYRGLFKQDSIARQQLDNQEALVRQYRGTLKIDQARVDNARLQLSFTRIKAPIAGRLGLRQMDPGNLVGNSDSDGLVVITQMQPIGVLFNLPEADLPAVLDPLRAGQQLQVEAWDRSATTLLAEGTLRTLDNRIDTSTGTIALKAEFLNSDEQLFPNQFVNVRLRVKTIDDATVIPAAAVQHGSAGSYVYMIADAADATDSGDDAATKPRVTIRRVDVGAHAGDRVAILRGIGVGDRVVLEGLDRLRENAEVQIIESDAPSTHIGQRQRDGDKNGSRHSGSGSRSHGA